MASGARTIPGASGSRSTRRDSRIGREWLRPGHHNHLRLTRIMQSLAALGLMPEAQAQQRCLVTDVYGGPGHDRITPDTYEYWMDALRGL